MDKQEAQKSVECEVPTSRIKIDDLPDLAIATILSFLPITELTEVIPKVCNKWRKASQDPIVWLDKEYVICDEKSDVEVLTTFRRVPQLRRLSMCRPVNDAVLNALCENCTLLTSLKIAYLERISYSLLNKLVMSCRNINSLSIPARLLIDEVNALILSHLLHLQSLEVFGHSNDDDKAIHLGLLGNGCPELSKVKLTWSNLCKEDMKDFIKGKCRTLTHLALSSTGLKESCLLALLKDCTALINLEMYTDHNNIGQVLEACTALSHLPNLRSLDLCFASANYPGDPPIFKFGGLFYLEVLKISSVYLHNSVVVAICEGCPNLKELHLSECRGLNNGDLKELYCLTKLETLSIISSGGMRGETLRHIAQAPNLRKLLLEGFNFRKLKSGVYFILHIHTLEILSFESITNLCFFPFDEIPQTLTKLRVLTVKDCELDPRIPVQLMQQMPGLRVNVQVFDDFDDSEDPDDNWKFGPLVYRQRE